MAKKKKKGKKRKGKKKKAVGPAVYLLRDNYKIVCKLMGEQPEPTILGQLNELAEDVKSNYNKMQYSELDLGPSGARCIAEALLGEFPAMEGGPFLNLNILRLWTCNVQDYGAVAIAKYLRNCPSVQLRLQTIDLFDNKLGVPAMVALGKAFSAGGNTTVKTLQLDYNPGIGSEGLAALCDGLRSNLALEVCVCASLQNRLSVGRPALYLPVMTTCAVLLCPMQTLTMDCCGIGEDGGRLLARLLSFSGSKLKQLKMMGNAMCTESLLFFALVLKRNRTLVELDLSDNGVGSSPPAPRDREALWKLSLALRDNDVFSKLNLDLNFIGTYALRLLSEFKVETNSLLPKVIGICMTSTYFAAGRPDIKEMFKNNSVPNKSKKSKKKKGRRKKKKKKK